MPSPYSLAALEQLETEGTLFAQDPPDGPYPDSTMSMWHAGLQRWMTPDEWILNSEPLAKGSMYSMSPDEDGDDDLPEFFQGRQPAVKPPTPKPKRGRKKDDRTTSMFDRTNDALQL